MIINEEQLKKEYSKNKNTEKNEEEIKKFMIDFNKEAKKQKSKWYAYMKSEFLHIRRSGFFSDIDLHMTNSNFYFGFCDNDFICGSACARASANFFKDIVGALPILKNIPQKIFILKDNSFSSLNKRLEIIENKLK